ncbi:CCR4-NOT transcription complex subunit 9-like isoform X3 [Papaver somniferum]|uniref:CCR4-NOT transcription complex subunit 9-like isoform X3 n=1 Tax=Papaver somniferum TaxID=3469 RepID=UPI000E6F506A|nr:CCR4-NOT transcription complex subunit 9-like isoform X3 [Papaver somniferum]
MIRPMAIPRVILELQDESSRETALRCLSRFLIEIREENPRMYNDAGHMLYYSFGTMSILLQEILAFLRKMVEGSLKYRSIKRIANVLTLIQANRLFSIAANSATREKLIDSQVPIFLLPVIKFKGPLEDFDNICAVALSVIGIMCQAREPKIIKWAVDNQISEACWSCTDTGNELTRVIGMHILEAILRNEYGGETSDLSNLVLSCSPKITILAKSQDYSPRLVFHVLRCYMLLCVHDRGFSAVLSYLLDPMLDGTFIESAEKFPIIGRLLDELLMTIGGNVQQLQTHAF